MELLKKYQNAIRQLLPKGRFFGQLLSVKKVLFTGIAQEFVRAHSSLINHQKGVLLESDFFLEHYQKLLGYDYSLEIIKKHSNQGLKFTKASLRNLINSYHPDSTIEVTDEDRMNANSACNSMISDGNHSTKIKITVKGRHPTANTLDTLEYENLNAELLHVLAELRYHNTTIIINDTKLEL